MSRMKNIVARLKQQDGSVVVANGTPSEILDLTAQLGMIPGAECLPDDTDLPSSVRLRTAFRIEPALQRCAVAGGYRG